MPRLEPVFVAAPEARATLAPESFDCAGLRPYQVHGVAWLTSQQSAVLADEMRLGKTAQTLRSLPPRAAAVVVCPAVARLVWRDECERWRPDLRARVGALRPPAAGEIVITNYDALPLPVPGWSRRLASEDYSAATLILDEVHQAKSPHAQRTRGVRLLGLQCARVLGITGTPLVGQAVDLWGVLVSCRLGHVFGTKRAFLRAFEHEPAKVRELLARVMLRRTRADVYPDLPAKQYQTIALDAPAELSHWLDALDARWSEIGRDELPPFELIAPARKALARARIPAALELARQYLQDGPLVVSSAHREPVLAAGRIYRAAAITGTTPNVERERVVRAFQAGELELLAITLDAGGVAIDLSRASRVLEVDLDWTPGINAQLEDRCVSVEKPECVHIVRLVSDHPLDRRVLEILAEKQERNARVL